MATLEEVQAELERRAALAAAVEVAKAEIERRQAQPAPPTAPTGPAGGPAQVAPTNINQTAATIGPTRDPAGAYGVTDGALPYWMGPQGRQALAAPIQRQDGASLAFDPTGGLAARVVDNVVGLDDGVQSYGETATAAINAAQNGVLFGYADEINGAGDALMGRGNRTEFYREQNRQLREDHPILGYGAEIAGAIAVPGAALKAGAGFLKNALRGTTIGSGQGAVYATGAAEGGIGERLKAAPIGAAGGAIGGAVGVPLAMAARWAAQKAGPVVARVLRQRRYFDGQDLTDEGREALEAAGIDPMGISVAFKRDFAQRLSQQISPVEAGRAVQMEEFNIPAVRANVTGSVEDFATLERARRGGMGDAAANRVRPVLDRQMSQARMAGEDIATGLSGGAPADQFDAAVSAQQGIRNARDASLGQARAAYDDLEAAGGGIRPSATKGLGARIENALRTSGVTVSPGASPNAHAAISELDGKFIGADRGMVPFMDIERARQSLVRYRNAAFSGSLGPDQVAMGRLVSEFDAQVDDIMTNAMIEGTPDVVEQARRARGLWREYSQQFTGDGAGSRFIQKMADEDASPDQVARWLFSSGRLGTGQFNSTLARATREALGDGSEEWNAIRQGAFRQLIQKPDGTVEMGPQRMSSNIAEFFNSPTTRALSRELFSDDERRLMLRYAGALRQMVPPPGSVNHSNTAYELSRMGQQAASGVASALGFASGGAAGAIAGRAGAEGLQAASNAITTRGILRPTGAVARDSRATISAFALPGFESFDLGWGALSQGGGLSQ